MCEHIAAFMHENDGGEYKAFFSRDGGVVGLYLLTTSEQYNFELADKLAEFAAPYIERGLLSSVTLSSRLHARRIGRLLRPQQGAFGRDQGCLALPNTALRAYPNNSMRR